MPHEPEQAHGGDRVGDAEGGGHFRRVGFSGFGQMGEELGFGHRETDDKTRRLVVEVFARDARPNQGGRKTAEVLRH